MIFIPIPTLASVCSGLVDCIGGPVCRPCICIINGREDLYMHYWFASGYTLISASCWIRHCASGPHWERQFKRITCGPFGKEVRRIMLSGRVGGHFRMSGRSWWKFSWTYLSNWSYAKCESTLESGVRRGLKFSSPTILKAGRPTSGAGVGVGMLRGNAQSLIPIL